MDVSDIRGWNRLGNTLSTGQQIVLYLTPGQALKFKEWAKQNKGEVAMADPQPKKYYQVRPGDTLSQIARMHQLSPQDLMSWNKLSASSVLKPGDQIVLIPPSKK